MCNDKFLPFAISYIVNLPNMISNIPLQPIWKDL